MPLQKPAAPDFGDPLGLLLACHERMLGFCATLEKLPAHLAAQGCDEALQQAAKRIHHYFSTAGKLHHEDEEKDVFPRLAHTSPQLADTIQRLQQDHTHMAATWTALEPLLAHPTTITDPSGFADLCARFTTAYREHIATENAFFNDEAQARLNHEMLQQIGRAMAERRHVDPDHIPALKL